jgi:hypothetical protein
VTLVSVEHCSRVGDCQQNPLVILSGLSYQGCMKSSSGQHPLAPHSGSFGSSSGNSCFLMGLGFPSMVQHAAPAFSRCWALIALTLVSSFQ